MEESTPTADYTIERIPTADGAEVACKRRANPDGTPVITIHGLASNADLWNLPDVETPDYHYRSLATVMHSGGYDVWLMNLRGHGGPHMLSTPPAQQTDWCVDHFVLYDLPAVVDHVRQVTGRKPFVIGASMGAMTLAGYVQGAVFAGTGGQGGIRADAALARQRQEALAGCVFVEFPAALRWPAALYDDAGRLRWAELGKEFWKPDGSSNYPFELLARWGWLQAILEAAGEVPLNWITGGEFAKPWWHRLPRPLAERAETLERAAVQTMLQLAGTFTGGTNHRADIILGGRRLVLDTMKAGVLGQLAKCVRQRGFISLLGQPDHIYSDHYDLVEVSTLVVHGGRDRIANPDVTRKLFFDRIPALDKHHLLIDELAHGEIEATPLATEKIYPEILDWLDNRNL